MIPVAPNATHLQALQELRGAPENRSAFPQSAGNAIKECQVALEKLDAKALEYWLQKGVDLRKVIRGMTKNEVITLTYQIKVLCESQEWGDGTAVGAGRSRPGDNSGPRASVGHRGQAGVYRRDG